MPSLRARQTPTVAVCPSSSGSDAAKCSAILAEAGLDLLEWQTNVLRIWLGRDETGHWASGTLGISLARQNGKTNGLVEPMMVYRSLVFGEWIVYTAHLQKTATETFESLRDIFESPALRKYVKTIKSAVGREEIILRDGGRIKFLARTRNGGRGQHGDLLVFDEAQALTSAQQASFLPVISASLNPQTIYAGTPPSPEDDGSVFSGIRAKALKGESNRTAWVEWSIDDITQATFTESWYETNPSLGVLIQETTIETECESMDLDEFARERCGWWAPEKAQEPPALDPELWDRCEVEEPPVASSAKKEVVACGIKFSPDGTVYSVSMAAKSPDRPDFVECYDRAFTNHGIAGLAEWLCERKERIALVAVDGREWTPTLIQKLNDDGFPKRGIHVMKTAEVADACSMLSGAVMERSVVHMNQPLLRHSVATSTRRPIGKDGWGFGGTDPTMVESVALAYWAVKTTKRNPQQKLKVSV